MEEEKRCKSCGFDWPLTFFRKHTDKRAKDQSRAYIYARRAICLGCESLKRDEPTQEARTLRKARNTIRNHAKKFGHTTEFMRVKFGWDPEHFAHDIQHAFSNGCPDCRFTYAEMKNGLADVTLDINDRDRPPYYQSNVRWICMTCNVAKQGKTPEEYAEYVNRMRQFHEKIRTRPIPPPPSPKPVQMAFALPIPPERHQHSSC